MAELPLLRRFPALARLERVPIGAFPTPVQRVSFDNGRTLLVKRDDLSGRRMGGNKVRGLEWLLGATRPRGRVLTVGPRGSTHALATALYAKQLGAPTTVVRWNQVMNAAARRVDARLRSEALVIDAYFVAAAYGIATLLRAQARVLWIPAGGASPLAILGHINAGLELAEQVERGECERPERVIVPFGTGGTAAGLALGFRIASLRTEVVAVRVAPKLIARMGRVLKLARSAASLIEELTGEQLPRVTEEDVVIEQRFYGGAYGRPLELVSDAERSLMAAGVRLDDTYSRKAFAAALSLPGNLNLLWLTFDGRLLQNGSS